MKRMNEHVIIIKVGVPRTLVHPPLSLSLPDDLTPQVTRYIRDVNPTAVALPYKLSKAYLSLLLYLNDKLKQLAMVSPVARNDIRSTAEDVMTVLYTSNERIEFLAAVT